jgi:hypothetical protein
MCVLGGPRGPLHFLCGAVFFKAGKRPGCFAAWVGPLAFFLAGVGHGLTCVVEILAT